MAINYRPPTLLHDKLREEADRTGRSIQQIIDAAVVEHFERQVSTFGAVAVGIVGNNQELFDRLRDL